MKRIMKLTVGDWAGDGHGGTETVIVELEGENLSNPALLESYNKTTEELGFDLCEEVFRGYEDSRLHSDKGMKIEDAGFKFDQDYGTDYGPMGWYSDASGRDHEVNAVALLLWWTGRHIEGFQWRAIRVPELIQGALNKSYGYGITGV